MLHKRKGRYAIKILKVINNNVVLSCDEKGQEIIVMGKGVGFGAHLGKAVPLEAIEKIFEKRGGTKTSDIDVTLNYTKTYENGEMLTNVAFGKCASYVVHAGLGCMDTLGPCLQSIGFHPADNSRKRWLTNGDLDGTVYGPVYWSGPVAYCIDLEGAFRVKEVTVAFERVISSFFGNGQYINPNPDVLSLKSYRFAVVVRTADNGLHVAIDQTKHTGNLPSRFFSGTVEQKITHIYAVILGHNGMDLASGLGVCNGWPAFTQIQAYGYELEHV